MIASAYIYRTSLRATGFVTGSRCRDCRPSLVIGTVGEVRPPGVLTSMVTMRFCATAATGSI